MMVKYSDKLIFFKDGKTIYVAERNPASRYRLKVYLMPLLPAYGMIINRIWNNAEHIKDYPELISWCGGGEKVRPQYTPRSLPIE